MCPFIYIIIKMFFGNFSPYLIYHNFFVLVKIYSNIIPLVAQPCSII